MIILRGKHAGHTAEIHQFANDWMTVDCDDCQIQSVVIKPLNGEFTEEELEGFRKSASGKNTSGLFWKYYRIDGNRLARNNA